LPVVCGGSQIQDTRLTEQAYTLFYFAAAKILKGIPHKYIKKNKPTKIY